MRWLAALILCLSLAPPLRACDLALALAVDISGSVDPEEFDVQMKGLAAGLRDGAVSEALLRGEAAITLVQWTGNSRQSVTVPWTRIGSFSDLETLAARISDAPRAWRNFSTAIGQALTFTAPLFAQVPDCDRRVIDISGDGSSNEGIDPRATHGALKEAGITVNALVIEGAEEDLTSYFWENVITGEGAFVVIANSFDEYPEKMRQKLLREVAKQVSEAPAAQTGDRFASVSPR